MPQAVSCLRLPADSIRLRVSAAISSRRSSGTSGSSIRTSSYCVSVAVAKRRTTIATGGRRDPVRGWKGHMGSRTRIRWINVARLAAGAIGCTALVVGLPALLERPKPPPLPPDVGLAPSAQGPTFAAHATRRTDQDGDAPDARKRQKPDPKRA